MIMNTLHLGTTNHTPNPQDHRTLDDSQLDAVTGGIVRSMPNGKTDVIKAMGNTKWGDIELGSGTR
jgi:hypothetical protein